MLWGLLKACRLWSKLLLRLLILLHILLRIACSLWLHLGQRWLLLELLYILLRIACVLRLKLRLLLAWEASLLRAKSSPNTCLLLRIAILLLTVLWLRAER